MTDSFAVRIGSDLRTFVDAQGQPFFWLGDTAWSLLTHYSRQQAEVYLRRRASQGFTVIQIALAWFDGLDGELDPNRIAANAAGDLPWLDGDPAQPNPAYFARVDTLLALARELDLTLALLPTWGSMVTDQHYLTAENAQAYGFWLGRHYVDHPNLVWINGGDCLPHGYEPVFDALAVGLRAGDGACHLMTFHPCHLHSSSQYCNDRPWYDFHLIQSWTDWHKVYEMVRADLAVIPPRPVVLGEGAYESGPEYPREPITPLVVRRQAWWAFLAGGYYTYGHNLIWRGGQNAEGALNAPGAAQMGILRQAVTSLPGWAGRLPDQSIIENGAGADETLNAAVRDGAGRWLIVYLSSRTHVLIRLEKLESPRCRAAWLNPATGERRAAGEYRTFTMPGLRQVRTSLYQWFSTPDYWEDAVLILEGIPDA